MLRAPVRRAVAGLFAQFARAYPNQIKESEEILNTWTVLLSDLLPAAIEAAGRKLLLEHEYPSLPAVGTVRRIALQMEGRRLSASKAWGEVKDQRRWRYSEFGLIAGLHRDGLPSAVIEAARRFGFDNLGTNQSLFAYERFRQIYEEVLSEEVSAEMPEPLEVGGIKRLGRRTDEVAV